MTKKLPKDYWQGYHEGFHDGAVTVLQDLVKAKDSMEMLDRISRWADMLELMDIKNQKKLKK